MRVWNSSIRTDIDGVMDAIVLALESATFNQRKGQPST